MFTMNLKPFSINESKGKKNEKNFIKLMLINCIFRQPNLFGVSRRKKCLNVYSAYSKRRRDGKTSWVLEKRSKFCQDYWIHFVPHFCTFGHQEKSLCGLYKERKDSSPGERPKRAVNFYVIDLLMLPPFNDFDLFLFCVVCNGQMKFSLNV